MTDTAAPITPPPALVVGSFVRLDHAVPDPSGIRVRYRHVVGRVDALVDGVAEVVWPAGCYLSRRWTAANLSVVVLPEAMLGAEWAAQVAEGCADQMPGDWSETDPAQREAHQETHNLACFYVAATLRLQAGLPEGPMATASTVASAARAMQRDARALLTCLEATLEVTTSPGTRQQLALHLEVARRLATAVGVPLVPASEAAPEAGAS